jgi:N-methylhydantoinase B
MPLFYGSATDSVRVVLEEYGTEELRPGDVLIANDYYRVGTHLNDICLIKPLFHRSRPVGALTIRAHVNDIGGKTMGGLEPEKSTHWEDGLRIPPTLLYSGGRPVKSALKLIDDNTRLGYLVVPDLITELHALDMGQTLINQTIDHYGLEAYVGAVRFSCDVSAEAMADALRSLPDGTYFGVDYLDGDGLPDSPEYAVRVQIVKAGDRAEFDFRGSSPSSRSSVNCAWPDIKTSIGIALKFLISHTTPVTSGTFRNIDVVVPPTAVFNARPPVPCSLYFAPISTIVRAIFNALNPVLGERAVAQSVETATMMAYGRRPDGIDGSLANAIGPSILGPWGANRAADGESGQQGINGNLITSGVEIFEISGPGVWLRTEYVPDSGGAGTKRGGASNLHDVMWRAPADHRMELLFHARRAPRGVNGGKSGPGTAAWLFDGDVSAGGTELPNLPVALRGEFYRSATPVGGVVNPETGEADLDGRLIVLNRRTTKPAGAVARVVSAAGGGWGDPLSRDPDAVRLDVRDGYVTFEGARRDYGVVVTGDLDRPEELTVDVGATERLRAQLRSDP